MKHIITVLTCAALCGACDRRTETPTTTSSERPVEPLTSAPAPGAPGTAAPTPATPSTPLEQSGSARDKGDTIQVPPESSQDKDKQPSAPASPPQQ